MGIHVCFIYSCEEKANGSSDRLEYPLEVRLIAPCKGSESVIALSIYKKKLLYCSHHTAEEIISHDMYLEQ